jgi:hypothetical protein
MSATMRAGCPRSQGIMSNLQGVSRSRTATEFVSGTAALERLQ